MEPVINVVAASQIDRLEPLWAQLLAHHAQQAAHLAALGAIRPPGDSWRLRRGQYLEWLHEPFAKVLAARDEGRLLGYAVVRVVEALGSWQWGNRIGVLETLVVDDQARGAGIGQSLLRAAREHLTELGIQVMKISVIAGNDGALRFYQREGAVDFAKTLVMPVSR